MTDDDTASPDRPAGTTTLVIDCDPGQDDVLALLLAYGATHVRRRLALVTTVAGNYPAAATYRHARLVMAFIARHGFAEVPVVCGMNRALNRPMRPYFRGDQELPGWTDSGPPVPATGRSAVDEIANLVGRLPERSVTVCALGPLTNIAMAILTDDAFAERVGTVVWMGGSIGPGNITPAAEFNALADPEAVQVVLDAGVELVVVPAEIGDAASVGGQTLGELIDLGTPFAAAASDLIQRMGNDDDHDRYVSVGRPMYDPTVIAYLAEPSIFTVAPAYLTIDTTSGPSSGATSFDLDGGGGTRPNITVVLDVERTAFRRFLLESLAMR